MSDRLVCSNRFRSQLRTLPVLGLLPLSILCLAAASASGSSLQPLYGASAGAVSQVSAMYPAASSFYTPVINGSNKLEIIEWLDTGTSIVRKTSTTDGLAIGVAAADGFTTGNATYFVTAIINGAGALQLISWKVNSNGSLTKAASYATATLVTDISIASNGGQELATACRDISGNLDVNVWTIGGDGSLNLFASATAGAVSRVAVAFTFSSATRFVTAVRNGSGNLEVTAWDSNDTPTLVREGTATAGAITQVAATRFNIAEGVYTAVVNGSGNLEMITWNIDGSGHVSRLAGANGEAASRVTICFECVYHFGDVFTASQNGAGNLGAELWSAPPATTLKELTFYDTVSAIQSVSATVSAPSHAVTASRDSNGNLALQVWNVTK